MLNLKHKYIRLDATTRLYNCPVPLLGLTGGIASGKSTVAKIFEQKNIPLISADSMVKYVYTQESSIHFIAKNFPDAIVKGNINFPILRQIVFSDNDARITVENFIYPKLPFAFYFFYNAFSNPHFVIYDVPLLYEKNLETKVDQSICVYSTSVEQIKRLQKRDQINFETAKKMLEAQMPLDYKKLLAHFVIDNSKDQESLKKSTESLIDLLTEEIN
ncbi:MAG: dephospho-CoA kinase [Bacteriovoracaceae bacterium]|nr:dephospho-CoA kinase [Bacteriovoracaceae bacterium]